MTDAQKVAASREFRAVRGQWNAMAVCETCYRDATKTRMSHYCCQCVDGLPFKCDNCLAVQQVLKGKSDGE